MANGKVVVAICIAPEAGAPMRQVHSVMAISGAGLEGDRYSRGQGSFNKGEVGRRQVTFMNSIFFPASGFDYVDSRRNIIVYGVELMWLIGREFQVGDAKFRGLKYCDPCLRPSKLSGNDISFQEEFFDRGGLVAEVLESGLIHVGSFITLPPKGY